MESPAAIPSPISVPVQLPSPSAGSVFQFQADVFLLKEGTLAYREEYELRLNLQGQATGMDTYTRAVDGSLLAETHVDFARSLVLPDVSFRNYRNGVEGGLTAEPDRSRVLVYRKKSSDKDFDRDRIRPTADMVTVQGVLPYCQQHFAELLRDKKLQMRLIVPERLDDFGIRVEVEEPKDGNPSTSPGILHMRLELSSWIIRLFAPKIEFDYDQIHQRLVAYRGPSLVPMKDGKLPAVEMRFRYPPTEKLEK